MASKLVPILISVFSVAPIEVPPELIEAFSGRMRAGTAKFEYNVTEALPRHGYVELTNQYSSIVVGSRMMITQLVDNAGVRARDPRSGTPALGARGSCLPQSRLFDLVSKEDWYESPGSTGLVLNATEHHAPVKDPRTIGLLPTWHSHLTPEQLIEALGTWGAEWSVANRKELTSVTSVVKVSRDASIETNWTLDPTKRFAPVEVSTTEHRPDGTNVLIDQCITDYALFDGIWWPKVSTWKAPLTNATQTIVFLAVEFDRPEHPKRISADLFGQPIGVSVSRVGLQDKYPAQQLFYVGDGRTVTEEEWQATKINYDLGPLQAYTQMMEQPVNQGHYPAWWNESTDTYGLYGVAYSPDLWEAYVRRWITKHRPGRQYKPTDVLDEKQINAAWAILEDCRKQVRPITERKGDTAPAASTSKPAAKPDPRIEAVFAELRKRLDGLLRQAQLAPTSTQPTQKPEPLPGRRPR